MALLIGAVALAVAAAAAVWLDGRRAQQALRVEVAQRLAGIESSAQADAKAQTQLATELRDAQAKIALLEARLAESQAQQAALEALYRDLAPSRDEIALSEIEQVLLVASQQLQLAGNVPSALTALQLADAKLQRLDRPQFVPLRRALSRDMDRLKAVPYVDVAGMSLKLDQAIAAVDTLPLAMDERVPPPAPDKAAPPADESAWRRLLREIWDDMQAADPHRSRRPSGGAARARRAAVLPAREPEAAAPDRAHRAARARRRELRGRSRRGRRWLKQYFDTRAKPVQALQATIKQLAATPMPGEMPDLTRSLEAVRVLRLAQDRAAPRRGAATAPRDALSAPAAVRVLFWFLLLAARGGRRRAGGQAHDAATRCSSRRRIASSCRSTCCSSCCSSRLRRRLRCCCASSCARCALPEEVRAFRRASSNASARARSRTPRWSRCSKAATASARQFAEEALAIPQSSGLVGAGRARAPRSTRATSTPPRRCSRGPMRRRRASPCRG